MPYKEPVRVLQVVGRMDRGGIENFIMNIYRSIDRTKIQFDFLAHYGREASFNDEIRSMGGRIYEMPAIRDEVHIYYWKLFEYVNALNRFFKEHNEYKIIHGQMTNTASIYMPIAKKYGVTTRIAHSHHAHGKIGMLGLITDILKIPVCNYATDLFACSEAAAKYFYPEKYLREGKVKIIPNAVDAKKFRYDNSKRIAMRLFLGISNKLVVGCVGRFRTEKNQIYLLDVLKKALLMDSNVMLLFAGDGPMEEKVKQSAIDMGIANNCIFLGMRTDISDIMQAMDVLAMPSFFEGLPVAGIEAQASGLHVIASTGVPDEMNVIHMVDYLELEGGVNAWAKLLIDRAKMPRIDTYDSIKKAGYDINTLVPWLQSFYLERV